MFTGPNIVMNGLVLNLDAANVKSYAGSGTTWRDLTGNNITGSLINGPTFSSLGVGSIAFDGVDDIINIQASSAYKPQFPLTVSSTVRFNSITNSAIIVTDNPTTDFHSGVHIFMGSSGVSVNYGNNTQNGSSGRRTYYAAATIITNLWYNVTCVLPNNLTCNIYLNGIDINASYSSGTATTLVYAGSPGSIGYKNDGGVKWLINGNISQVQIYNRALSALEVLQNYNGIKSRFGL